MKAEYLFKLLNNASGYPWAKLPAGTVVCDMGSSVGHISMTIARANPGVNVVLQDLPKVMEQAKSFWSQNASDLVEKNRVQFVPFDFLKDPPVAGCDYYYVSDGLRCSHSSL